MKFGPLWLTQHKTGKLEGFLSLNTSSTDNPYCQSNPTDVCIHCYAKKLEQFRSGLHQHLTENSRILSTTVLDPHELPSLDTAMPVRFNSFGELINAQHVANLWTIARANPKVKFALWTKLEHLITAVPPNVQLLKSWGSFDVPDDHLYEWLEDNWWFDKVFVVDTADNGQVNCQRRCKDCMWCYDGTGPQVIRELLRR